MSCFVYATDAHARASTPSGRIDDYPTAILDKLQQVGTLAEEKDALCVVFGGDLFHEPDPSTSIKNQVLSLLMKYPCPVYGVWGSHDVFGYNQNTLGRTALGTLAAAGAIRILYPQKALRAGPFDIVGLSHSYDIDDPAKHCYDLSRLEIEGTRPKSILVEVAHGMLLDKPFAVGDAGYTLLKDVHTEAHYLLSGHFHPGYPVTTIGRTTFCNPGSLGRLENTEGNRSRPVQVAVVDEEGIEMVSLRYRAAEEVFSGRIIKDNNSRGLDAFVKQLHQQVGAIDTQDTKDLVLRVAKERKASKEVCSELIDIVERAQQEA